MFAIMELLKKRRCDVCNDDLMVERTHVDGEYVGLYCVTCREQGKHEQ